MDATPIRCIVPSVLSPLLVVLLAASPAPSGARPLQHDLLVDGAITLTTGAWWIASETVLKKKLAPRECRLCERGADGSDRRLGFDLLGTRLKLVDPYLDEMDTASNLLAFAILPAAVFGTHVFAARDNQALFALPLDALLVAEAMMIAGALNQTVKLVAGRSRPFVFRLGQDSPLSEHPEDNNLSFYSGHASFAFSMVAASATIAELRGYRLAKWIWVIGLPLAATMPLMRMAADKHYATDVLIGSIAGLAIGILVPRKFHARVGDGIELSASVSAGGAMVSGQF